MHTVQVNQHVPSLSVFSNPVVLMWSYPSLVMSVLVKILVKTKREIKLYFHCVPVLIKSLLSLFYSTLRE